MNIKGKVVKDKRPERRDYGAVKHGESLDRDEKLEGHKTVTFVARQSSEQELYLFITTINTVLAWKLMSMH